MINRSVEEDVYLYLSRINEKVNTLTKHKYCSRHDLKDTCDQIAIR